MANDIKRILDGAEEEIVPEKHSMHSIHPFWLEHSIFKSLDKLKL
jgi:hypothetical protein